MYTPAVLAEMASPHINPYGKSRIQCLNEDDRLAAVEEWISRYGKEPSVAIGLQASQISWDNGACFYEAGDPWWR
ncbi:hypothetical protein QJS10_CPA09g01232 [Acorus calamus]|uniref:Uncharacterized protein n=1 Tax=Acorus calamus TaxID=4465 RepID=A0AAV9E714_ACOCL|nr:hypothetical protein QJS10_CPA09g01232 [Acorus calamus]